MLKKHERMPVAKPNVHSVVAMIELTVWQISRTATIGDPNVIAAVACLPGFRLGLCRTALPFWVDGGGVLSAPP